MFHCQLERTQSTQINCFCIMYMVVGVCNKTDDELMIMMMAAWPRCDEHMNTTKPRGKNTHFAHARKLMTKPEGKTSENTHPTNTLKIWKIKH